VHSFAAQARLALCQAAAWALFLPLPLLQTVAEPLVNDKQSFDRFSVIAGRKSGVARSAGPLVK
jgi:hypothetical protein